MRLFEGFSDTVKTIFQFENFSNLMNFNLLCAKSAKFEKKKESDFFFCQHRIILFSSQKCLLDPKSLTFMGQN